MNTLRFAKNITLGAILLASMFAGVPAAQADYYPAPSLSISNGNWNPQAGTSVTVNLNGVQYWNSSISYAQILRFVPGKSDELTLRLCSANQTVCDTSFVVPQGTTELQGKIVYQDGRTYVTPRMPLSGWAYMGDQTAPKISLTVLPSSTGNDQYATLLATATEEKSTLQNVKIVRVDNGKRTTEKLCTNLQYCNFEMNLGYNVTTAEIGKTLWYEAEARDSANNAGYSNRVSITVIPFYPSYIPMSAPPLNQNFRLPSVDTIVDKGSLAEDKTMTLYGQAYNENGIWGMEMRAVPSWSNDMIVKTCTFAAGTKSGPCSMTIGPFKGHAGQTVKVYTLAWDAKYGYGNSSYSQLISITPSASVNASPKVTITPSTKAAYTKERVAFNVKATDENGINKIDIYVNAKVVATCKGTTTCSYESAFSQPSVTYAAKVWDKTGKFTWTGYDYVTMKKR
jgi:hypothetical protein